MYIGIHKKKKIPSYIVEQKIKAISDQKEREERKAIEKDTIELTVTKLVI